MLNFYILTIFPHIFDGYFQESIIKRAREKGKVKIETINLRDYAADKHKTVDDTPYGGGAGMVMKVEPIFKAVQDIKERLTEEERKKTLVVLLSAKGKLYTQQQAAKWSDFQHIILICGRYEGVDERVAQYIADEEISIGPYVLTGGEIPAMVVVDSVTRLLPGVLGNQESLKEESYSVKNNIKKNETEKDSINQKFLEYPQYTKPEEFQGWKVPKVLLSGNHQKIKAWRRQHSSVLKLDS